MASSDKLINLVIAGGIVYFGIQFINSGQLQPIIDQLMSGLGGGGAPAPPGGEGGGTTPPAGGTGSCDCSCMPMDSDPSRWKIETPAGEDCYNHVYPNSEAECQTALTEVCASRGGGSGGGTTPPAGGGGDEAEGGGDDEGGGEDEEDSNYARRAYYIMRGFR